METVMSKTKNAFAILTLILLSHTAFAVPKSRLYQETVSMYEKFTAKYDIAMFGDSLIQRGNWQDMFPEVRIANRGIGGDDTEGMLARIDSVEHTGAHTIFVQVGTNDLNRKKSPEEITNNIKEIAEKISNKKINVIILSVILASKEHVVKNKLIKKINSDLKKENGRYKYLDLNVALAK
ncbi:hypothetical protein CG692_23770 [Escherichia coli]|nr:hypothetical protein CG692_23770 [Escherichia coli]